MQRMRELIAAVNQRYPKDKFFDDLEQTLRDSRQARAMYRSYDRALQSLDSASWEALQKKSVEHFRDYRLGQLKQGFFNQINDAFAYEHLSRRGYSSIRVLRESGTTTPDIEYFNGQEIAGCEVKTLGISDDLIQRRESMSVFSGQIYEKLSVEYIKKLNKVISEAQEQILSRYSGGLVYLVAHFDDFTMSHYSNYRLQLKGALGAHDVQNIYIKVGLLRNRRIEKSEA